MVPLKVRRRARHRYWKPVLTYIEATKSSEAGEVLSTDAEGEYRAVANVMYSVISNSPDWVSPSWGVNAAAIAHPPSALRRKIQQLQCEVSVSCENLGTSFLDGLCGIRLLDFAQKAASKPADKSTGAVPDEDILPAAFWSQMPSYIRSRTAWVGISPIDGEKLPKVFGHGQFSRSLLGSACKRLRETFTINSPLDYSLFDYSLLYLWHGKFIIEVFDDGHAELDLAPPERPWYTATLYFTGDNYESQMIWLPVFLHTLLCENMKTEGTQSLRPRLRLLSRSDFVLSSAAIYPVPKDSMAARLQAALLEKLRRNWQGVPFISHIHSRRILNEESVVHCLAREQEFIGHSDEDPIFMAQRAVGRWLRLASGMLTMCMLQDQDFLRLEYLVNAGITDENFSAGLVLGIHQAARDGQKYDLNSLLSLRPSYSARRLVSTRKIIKVQKDEVIPMFYRQSEGLVRADRRSEVHRVHFEPGYQTFAENPMETFLLKIFRISHGTGPGTSYDGFSRLAHPHLVTHLGGWSMENELFLVFPTPALTLYDLLRTSGHAYITEKGLNNILGQLAGIGSAIAYLSKLQPIRKGFHHDIRSDDILLFPIEGQEDHLYVWKLGSFGTNREMFNFMEGPKRNSKRYRLRSYMSLRSYYETDYPTGLDSGKSDVRSFGGICREVWVWLDGLKRGKSADPIESWKPGMPSVENGNGGEERIAEIARKCLTVDQEARISPSALVLEFDAFLSPSDTFDHRDANPVDTHEAISLPESPSLAPLDVFSKMSSLSSAEIRELNESTLLHEADRSSLDARINHIDGWAIAELGLGIEPYDLRGAAQWYRAAMLEKTAQESFVDSEDALVAGRKTLLPAKQTQVPVSAKPLETDQSRKIHHNEQAGKIAANLQTESLGPQHLGLESQAVAPDKIANASLAQGLVPWSNLSSEEQEACVGVPWRGFGIVGSSIWFEPEGLLKTLWKTRLRSEVHARIEALISTNPTFQEMFDGPRLGAYSLHLVVMRHPPTQQFQPTIVILSSTKKVSQRLVQALEKQQWWEQMGLSFDLIAHTGVGRLM